MPSSMSDPPTVSPRIKAQHRFADIRAAVPGLSDTMLAQRLRELAQAGLIQRRVIPSTPVRVEYDLTDKGRELEPVMRALSDWAHKWLAPPEDRDLDVHSHASM